MNIGQIVAEITATTTGLRKAQQDANKQFGQIQNEADATSKVVKTAFAVAGTAAVLGFVAALAKATDGANETRKAMLGLESTSKAFGQNFEDANKSVKELYSDGMMPLDKSIRGFKNLLSVGFSVDEAMQISKSLKDIGAFNNVVGDLGQAYEDSTKGLKTGSMELIENIGLTQRLSTVMKNANIDMSNGIDITNNAAQRRAVYNAILAEGAKFEGNAAKLANDNAAASAKLSAAWKELSDNLGNRASPAFASILIVVTELTKGISNIFKKDRIDEANDYADAIFSQQIQFDTLVGLYEQLSKKQNKSSEEMKLYRDTIDEMKKLYPDYLGNLDMEKGKYEDIAKAIDGVNKKLALKAVYAKKEKELAAVYEDMANAQVKIREIQIKAEETIAYAKARGNKDRVAVFKWGFAPASMSVEDFRKETQARIEWYKKDLISSQKKINDINAKYAPILGGYDAKAEDKAKAEAEAKAAKAKAEAEAKAKAEAEAKAKAEEEARKKAEEEAKKKAEFKPDTEKTLAQKKKELEYKKQIDLANAKEEEKYLIELKHKTALAVLDAEDKYNKAIAGAKNQKTAKKAMDELISSVGQLELDLKIKEKNIDYAKNALGLTNLEAYGVSVPIQADGMQEAAERLIYEYKNTIDDMATEFLNKLKGANAAVGLTDVSNYGVPKPEPVVDNSKETEQAFKDLDAALKNMIDVIDNDVITALYSLGEGGKSFINSFKGFQAGQTQGGLLGGLGMLTGGIGMFTSAVSIFQTVGGLFHKSTYNFDEAVKKMVAKIGDMTPEEQLAQVKKARAIAQTGRSLGLSELSTGQIFTAEEAEKLKAAGAELWFNANVGAFQLKRTTLELLAAAKEVIPNLSEALGTAVEDFRQDISSVLGDSANYSDMENALYNAVFSSVKQGLINAYLLNEPILKLTEKLRDTVTESVADGILTAEEKAQIQEITGEVNESLKPFIEGMQAVGLDLIGASDSLADATDNFSSTMNRNLKLAERISKDSLGNSQIINIDLAGANLGGMNEANTVNSLNKAVAMSNIVKVGVR